MLSRGLPYSLLVHVLGLVLVVIFGNHVSRQPRAAAAVDQGADGPDAGRPGRRADQSCEPAVQAEPQAGDQTRSAAQGDCPSPSTGRSPSKRTPQPEVEAARTARSPNRPATAEDAGGQAAGRDQRRRR